MKKNSWKLILILVLVVVLAAGSVGGYFALAHQNPSQVLDHTQGGKSAKPEADKDAGDSNGDIPTQAVLNQSVTMFTDKESDKINDSILSLEPLTSGVEMEIKNGSAIENVGVGDIFFLPGDEDTPFGMTYIGKISSVIPGTGTSTYLLETPMMDEVFDVLSFSQEGILSPENLIAVECIPGVTLEGYEDVQQVTGLNAAVGGGYGATVLADHGATVIPLDTISNDKPAQLVFKTEEIELLELLGDKKKEPENQKTVDFMEGDTETVYITKTGQCYHTITCRYLKKGQESMTLTAAVDKGRQPCTVCKPPLLKKDDGTTNFDTSLTLQGHFGIKDLNYSATCNWDILAGEGMEELSFYVDGTFTAGLTLKGNLEFEIGGRTTRAALLDEGLIFEGLKEHLFPLAAVHYGVGLAPVAVAGGNAQIRALTAPVPLSVIGIVYVDLQGNISTGFTATFNYDRDFEYNYAVVKDGEFVFENTFETDDPEITAGISAEITADVDFHVGAGLDLYVFNLKVAQMDLAQLGVEAAGEAKLQYSTEVANQEEEPFSLSGHVRGYFKLLQLTLGIQAKEDVIPLVDLSFDLGCDFCLWDFPLFKIGTPTGTRYDPNTMSYNHVTAKDSTAKYYKNTQGQLVREMNGYRTVLRDEEFFTICGIDETYIYILEDGESYTHNVRRIAKDGSTSKVVVEDVDLFLTNDEEYLYFVPKFDRSAIRKLDRATGDIETFASYSKNVIRMVPQGDNFYVAAGQGSSLGYFSGDYMLVGKDGNTITNYGSRPSVSQMEKVEFKNYHVAKQITSTGYLRDTALDVYWVGANGSYINIDPVTGWNYFEGGIITMERADGGYNIVLYRASDGSKVTLGPANHSHALFTAAQADSGRWYYIDQTSNEVFLYTVSPDLGAASIVQTMSRSNFLADLSQCSVVLSDNQLYFYTISNNRSCQVLHIFNLY